MVPLIGFPHVEARDRGQQAFAADREVRLEVETRAVHVAGEQRDIDDLSLAGFRAVLERGEDAEREHHGRIHRSVSGIDGRLSGLREQRHHAGARGGEFVERRKLAVGTFRAEAGAARVDHVRPQLHERLVVPAGRQDLGQRAIDRDDVSARDQRLDDRAPLGSALVDDETALVALGELGLPVPRRRPRGRGVARASRGGGILDPQHLRAEVTEQRHTERRPEGSRPVEDDEAFERAAHRGSIRQRRMASSVLSSHATASGSGRPSHAR
ncbi:MAG: hypothetical protein M5U32_03845 [Myxococcota bacterium]|nr:hypothetical protein [Myxococcota bacterium]